MDLNESLSKFWEQEGPFLRWEIEAAESVVKGCKGHEEWRQIGNRLKRFRWVTFPYKDDNADAIRRLIIIESVSSVYRPSLHLWERLALHVLTISTTEPEREKWEQLLADTCPDGLSVDDALDSLRPKAFDIHPSRLKYPVLQ